MGAAAREVSKGNLKSLNHGAGDSEATETFEGFVEDVAGIKVWGDKDIGVAFDGGGREFFGGNVWVDSGVELHFAVYYPIWVGLANLVDDVVDLLEVGVFATGAISRVREHGDFGCGASISLESIGGVFDDDVE